MQDIECRLAIEPASGMNLLFRDERKKREQEWTPT